MQAVNLDGHTTDLTLFRFNCFNFSNVTFTNIFLMQSSIMKQKQEIQAVQTTQTQNHMDQLTLSNISVFANNSADVISLKITKQIRIAEMKAASVFSSWAGTSFVAKIAITEYTGDYKFYDEVHTISYQTIPQSYAVSSSVPSLLAIQSDQG